MSASNHFLIIKRPKKKIANNTSNKTLAQQSPVYVPPPDIKWFMYWAQFVLPGKHSNKANWSLLWQFYINFNALINRIIRHHHHHHSPYHHHYISYILILSGVCVVWLTVLPCPPQYPPPVLLHTRPVHPCLWTSLSSSSSSSSSASDFDDNCFAYSQKLFPHPKSIPRVLFSTAAICLKVVFTN